MKQETHAYFRYLLNNNMSITHFIDSDFTFVNRDLSLLYRMKGVKGRKFRKVKLNDPKRGGLLGHASVTSKPFFHSTRQNLMCGKKWRMKE